MDIAVPKSCTPVAMINYNLLLVASGVELRWSSRANSLVSYKLFKSVASVTSQFLEAKDSLESGPWFVGNS